jgi:hypothetical protein
MAGDFESKKAERILIEQEIANEFKGTPDMFSPGGLWLDYVPVAWVPFRGAIIAGTIGILFLVYLLLQPRSTTVDDFFFWIAVCFALASMLGGALVSLGVKIAKSGRARKGWLYPLAATLFSVGGGYLLFSALLPPPPTEKFDNIEFLGCVAGFSGGYSALLLPFLCGELRRSMRARLLRPRPIILWVRVMAASHPWTASTAAGPVATTIVIGVLAAALLGQF